MDAENKQYYAKWSAANSYTVAYTLNDGTPTGHPAVNPNTVTSYTVLDPNVTLAPATRTGYDFEGWYENPAFTGSPVTVSRSAMRQISISMRSGARQKTIRFGGT